MNSLVSDNTSFVHSGTVSRISGSSVFVALDKNVHCDSCRVKAACGISESKNKEVEITNPLDRFSINENVKVVLKKSTGFKAVFWAYLFPFILMMIFLVVGSQFLAEWQAGLLALVVLVPYYLLLKYLNSFFKKKFEVSVLKLA